MEGGCKSVTETIAACGFETSAPQPGRHSFTNTLIAVLDDWQNRPAFTAAMLHCEILNRLRHEKPERYRDSKKFEFRKSPIHITSTSNLKARSVELSPRLPTDIVEDAGCGDPEGIRVRGASVSMIKSLISNCRSDPPSSSLTIGAAPGEESDPYDAASLTRILDDGNTALPQVLISLALEKDQSLDFQQCRGWLQDFPAFAKYARAQGIYKSNSTLLILSIPVVVWDWIPNDPACSFIGYVHSQNIWERIESEKLVEDLKKAAVIWDWIPDQVSPVESAESRTLVEDTEIVGSVSAASEILVLSKFALQSSLSLSETVESFQSNPRVTRELKEELEALNTVLKFLQQAAAISDADFSELQPPLFWCGRACKDFEAVLIKEMGYSRGPRTSFRDWVKLNYTRHFIDFKNMLSLYVSTISTGFADILLYVL